MNSYQYNLLSADGQSVVLLCNVDNDLDDLSEGASRICMDMLTDFLQSEGRATLTSNNDDSEKIVEKLLTSEGYIFVSREAVVYE